MDVYIVPPVGPAELLICETATSTGHLVELIYAQTKKICRRLVLANPYSQLDILWEH